MAARFGLREPRVIVAGFSLGAIYASHWIADNPRRFAATVLVEGGYNGWTAGRIRHFVRGCGGPVLAVCGQTVCRNAVKLAEPAFAAAGGTLWLSYEAHAGHTYGGPLSLAVRARWPELLSAALAPCAG
jgi:pimeloyl-ACP methyl ester carboxylesterase